MSLTHAVVWVDHQSAQVLRFDAEHIAASKIRAHTYHTAQHGSAVRTQHEFFGEVCTVLAGIPETWIVGSHTSIADFRHYVEKHRPDVAPHICGWELADHPTEKQLIALARKAFLKHDQMTGSAPLH